MKKIYYVFRLKRILVSGGIILLMGLIVFQSEAVIHAVGEGILLCGKTVIPSLFPFLVLSDLLLSGGFAKWLSRLLSGVMKPLFRVNGAGALSFVLGIVSGYPTGAAAIKELYQTDKITKDEALRLLPFCNNAGPLFVIGGVGTAMLGHVEIGIFLYAIHVLSALLVGLCFRFYGSPLPGNFYIKKPFSVFSGQPSFTASVHKAVQTMLLICGYILLFSAISACISPLLIFVSPKFSFLVKGMLEVTGGCRLAVENCVSPEMTLMAISFFVGFGGFCVLLQTAGILSGTELRLKTYFFGKTIQGVVAAFLTRLFYPILISSATTAFASFGEIDNYLFSFGPYSFLMGTIFLIFLFSFLRKKW